MDLEQRVTGGRVTWLECVEYDNAKESVVVRVTHHANFPPLVARVVTFLVVRDYEDVPHDAGARDSNLIETLIGLDERRRGTDTQYIVVTDEREITFRSSAPVQIVEGGPG